MTTVQKPEVASTTGTPSDIECEAYDGKKEETPIQCQARASWWLDNYFVASPIFTKLRRPMLPQFVLDKEKELGYDFTMLNRFHNANNPTATAQPTQGTLM